MVIGADAGVGGSKHLLSQLLHQSSLKTAAFVELLSTPIDLKGKGKMGLR